MKRDSGKTLDSFGLLQRKRDPGLDQGWHPPRRENRRLWAVVWSRACFLCFCTLPLTVCITSQQLIVVVGYVIRFFCLSWLHSYVVLCCVMFQSISWPIFFSSKSSLVLSFNILTIITTYMQVKKKRFTPHETSCILVRGLVSFSGIETCCSIV